MLYADIALRGSHSSCSIEFEIRRALLSIPMRACVQGRYDSNLESGTASSWLQRTNLYTTDEDSFHGTPKRNINLGLGIEKNRCPGFVQMDDDIVDSDNAGFTDVAAEDLKHSDVE